MLKYFDDYVLIVDEEGEMLLLSLNDELSNFVEVSKFKEWIDVCLDELFFIEKNEVWILVDLLSGVKLIGFRWIFKIKRNLDGFIKKYKVCFVVKGYVQ